MRKIFFVFVAMLWIAAGIQLVQNLNQQDEGQIVQAFNKTNCMNAMSKIQINSPLEGPYKTIGEQREMLKKLANGLGITGNYEIIEEKDGAQTTVQLYKEAAKAETRMRVISVESEVSDNVVETIQYLLVEIQLYDKLECAISYKSNLETMVSQYGITENVTLQFSGELPGKLSHVEKKEIIGQLLDSISAKQQSEYTGEDMYTVYAYSDIIDETQTINGKSINVTIAINYNKENHQTGLYLATPFLNEDY